MLKKSPFTTEVDMTPREEEGGEDGQMTKDYPTYRIEYLLHRYAVVVPYSRVVAKR